MNDRRLFVAIDLAIHVVERLVLLQQEWAARVTEPEVRIRWTDAENIHVTLKFLGGTDTPIIPLVEETLDRLTRPLFPFEVGCQRIGAFPSIERPRILWAGLDPKGAEVMSLLQLTIERELAELGFAPEDRDYHPHVTLGRVKSTRAIDMTSIATDLAEFDFGKSFVKDIALYESALTPSGPRYTVLNRFSLGEG